MCVRTLNLVTFELCSPSGCASSKREWRWTTGNKPSSKFWSKIGLQIKVKVAASHYYLSLYFTFHLRRSCSIIDFILLVGLNYISHLLSYLFPTIVCLLSYLLPTIVVNIKFILNFAYGCDIMTKQPNSIDIGQFVTNWNMCIFLNVNLTLWRNSLIRHVAICVLFLKAVFWICKFV